jgi:hypothetical protein
VTLPNSSETIASGGAFATHTISALEYQPVIVTDESGHLAQTVPTYFFCIKNQAGAAAKDHFDIFNATGSGKILELRGLWGTAAINVSTVAGTLSPDFDLLRTSTVGTGGTTLTMGATTFPSISMADTTNPALPAQVTIRAAPTAGATIDDALFPNYLTQEETQAGAQLQQWQNMILITAVGQRPTARENQGFKLRQITLGQAGNWTFIGLFTLV